MQGRKFNRERILVVDDDPDIRRILQDRLESSGHEVWVAESGTEALSKVDQKDPGLMLLDLQMPEKDGFYVLDKLKGRTTPSVIVMTAFGSIDKAVEAMKKGAFDFVTKPFTPDHLDLVISRAIESKALKQENFYLQDALNTPYLQILGESKIIKKAIENSRKVSTTSSSVLLLGESGTGKEIFARTIHRWSPRSKKPFVVVNCVALHEDLLESELFGHEKGSFTGAYQVKEGKLEIANGGTVFLDEIGDFNPGLQSKLLRVIQEREFERVGGNRPIRVDIRIIAATHRDLVKEVKEGRFREDLFFRLNVVSIALPSLKERKEDIPLLADFFLERFSRTMGKPGMKISEAAKRHLINYHWPGNVRELSNLIERGVVLANDNEIKPDDLPLQVFKDDRHDMVQELLEEPYHEAVYQFQIRVIKNALQKTGGNQARAAEILRLQRTYLSRLIRNFKIKTTSS
ncbi:MAG: sigma-54-dependent Fis family transcriptional regulator [Nitrospirae bacterium]|nr:sigma-54-dependent Fis family transcriptional regulator [Nitrospirota bacterium]